MTVPLAPTPASAERRDGWPQPGADAVRGGAGAGPRRGIRPVEFLALAFQLGALMAIVRFFSIEPDRGLVLLTPLILAGFSVHAWLPFRLRLPFFVLLTVAALVILMGPAHAAILIGLGLALLGICHLPVPALVRIGLVVAVVIPLAAVHSGWRATSWSAAVIPVLASFFMFRLILYIYDTSTRNSAATVWQRVGYFFMLPNLFFPLFPVVDYRTWLRTYYQRDAREIYQTGLLWILRGLSHLVLYRFIYHLLPSVEMGASGLVGVLAVVSMTFGLYLRLSGLFHLAIGLLCLFGFDLPETHHRYFLASGFTDLWRRINIYWKDFMMTVFFYPTVTRARKAGLIPSLIIGTIVVIVMTWLLHSYQWFWLRGEFPLTVEDGVFWGVLGVALAITTVREARGGRKRRLGQGHWSLREAVGLSARTALFFLVMATLWSLWDTGSFEEWLRILGGARDTGAADLAAVIGIVGGAIAIGTLWQWVTARGWTLRKLERPSFERLAAATGTAAAVFALAGLPAVHGAMGTRIAGLAGIARSNALNDADQARQERGYYENLTRATRFTSPLATQGRDPRWVPFAESEAVMRVRDLRLEVYRPDLRMVFKDADLGTNRWGMRDQEYERAKPSGTRRIAILGASYVAGSGVDDGESFEARVEARLNREGPGAPGTRYQVLNFAVPNFGAPQVLHQLRHNALAFEPDVVVVVVQPGDVRRTARSLARAVAAGVPMQEPIYEDALRRAGVAPRTAVGLAEDRLMDDAETLLLASYARMVELSRAQGATPVWVYLPRVGKRTDPAERAALADLASRAGFVTLSLEDVFAGLDAADIQIAPFDEHPNEIGHQRIADVLYARLIERADEIGL